MMLEHHRSPSPHNLYGGHMAVQYLTTNMLHQLHWTAGFLEGEGYFYTPVRFPRTGGIEITATQVQREPLERLQLYWQGNIIWRDNSKYGRNKSAIFRWSLSGSSAAALMMMLYDLMSPKR